jgi:membrane protease YdiL (CAAX protease family)
MITVNEDSIRLGKGELVAAIALLISVAFSITLLYDSIKKDEHEKGLYTNNEAYQFLIIYRIVLVVIFGYLTYNNYQDLKIGEKENQDLRPLVLDLLASAVAVVGALIFLYADYKYYWIQNNPESAEPTF